MKKLILFQLSLFACFISCKALDYDLYNIDDVKGISEERKSLLYELSGSADELDYFKHFYFSSGYSNELKFKSVENGFIEFVNELEEGIRGIKKPSNHKTIQFIYETVNSN